MPVGLGGTVPEGLIFLRTFARNISSEHHAQPLILKSTRYIGQTQPPHWEYTSRIMIAATSARTSHGILPHSLCVQNRLR